MPRERLSRKRSRFERFADLRRMCLIRSVVETFYGSKSNCIHLAGKVLDNLLFQIHSCASSLDLWPTPTWVEQLTCIQTYLQKNYPSKSLSNLFRSTFSSAESFLMNRHLPFLSVLQAASFSSLPDLPKDSQRAPIILIGFLDDPPFLREPLQHA